MDFEAMQLQICQRPERIAELTEQTDPVFG
jgi:hypothetical protein